MPTKRKPITVQQALRVIGKEITTKQNTANWMMKGEGKAEMQLCVDALRLAESGLRLLAYSQSLLLKVQCNAKNP